MKESLSTIVVVFVCKVCQRTSDREDINIQESMDQGNDVCPDRVGKCCHVEDLLSGGGGTNSA